MFPVCSVTHLPGLYLSESYTSARAVRAGELGPLAPTDESTMTVTLKPTPAWKIGGPAFLLGCSGLMFASLDGHLSPGGWSLQEWIVSLLGTFFLVAAIELPTRSLVLDGGLLRKRGWFVERSREMPLHMAVVRDFKGRVTIVDAQNGRPVATLTREFGVADRLDEVITHELRQMGRLSRVA